MNAATMVTMSRIVIAPVFATVFALSVESGYHVAGLWVSMVLLGLMELSDAVDGYIARSMNQVTSMGKLFDPIADTICHSVMFLSFVVVRIIPLWLYLIFFYREMFIIMLRITCLHGNRVVPAGFLGKLKTFTQGTAVFAVLALMTLRAHGVTAVPEMVAGRPTGFWIVLVPAFFSVISAIAYFADNWSMFTASMRSQR